MLVIRNTLVIPPEGWQYPGVNHVVSALNWRDLFPAIQRDYQSAHQKPPSRQQVIDWVCTNLDASCYEHKLGDRIERGLGMIPGLKKLPCYDAAGKLKLDTGCGKAKERLNAGEPIIPTIIKRIKGV